MRSPRGLRAVSVFLLAGALAVPVAADRHKTAVPSTPDDKTVLHVMNRIAFGPRPGDVERVKAMGLAAYIEQQLHPERIPDGAVEARLAGMETLTKSPRDLADQYFIPAQQARQQAQQQAKADAPMAAADAKPVRTPEEMEAARRQRLVIEELSSQKVLRAAYSDRQLEEVMTDFWFNHFNVFAGKGPAQIYLTEYERDTIRPRALGKFRDLLEATAKSPAMLFYLDNWESADPNAPDPRELARRRMQERMFTPRARRFPVPPPRPANPAQNAQQRPKRGLNENYGRELMELHTLGVDGGYTQQDVVEVARCFTGWTITTPRLGGEFRFEPRMHDNGTKLVLGHRIKANGGEHDGEQVLDILASHPSTARFISTKLVRRFVSDTPPPALVSRAAERFRQTDGDIREVLRTILTSPEFFAAEAYRAKVKSPFEFVVSAVRATNADVTNALPLLQAVRQLGEPLYMCQPPTGYPDRADAWVNTGTLLNRMNFALALVSGRMRGVVPQTIDALDASALAGDVSPSTRATLVKTRDPKQLAALTLGSPEFQRR